MWWERRAPFTRYLMRFSRADSSKRRLTSPQKAWMSRTSDRLNGRRWSNRVVCAPACVPLEQPMATAAATASPVGGRAGPVAPCTRPARLVPSWAWCASTCRAHTAQAALPLTTRALLRTPTFCSRKHHLHLKLARPSLIDAASPFQVICIRSFPPTSHLNKLAKI